MPGDLAGGRGPGSTREELIHEELFAPWPGFVHAFVVFADSLFRHNAMVGLLCFGLGFALGVPTLILLLYNGLTIGAFLALHVERGLGIEFMGWLSIHGVTEILAVLLCGAAGLVVAEKIVFPGRLSRLENLARHGALRGIGRGRGGTAVFCRGHTGRRLPADDSLHARPLRGGAAHGRMVAVLFRPLRQRRGR